MDKTNIKSKYIFFPFLIVSIGTIIFYNAFRWFFDFKLGVLPINENLLDIWIPLVFSWISVLIWLRKRVQILDMKGRTNRYYSFLSMMAMAVAIPIIVSQVYIEKASFELISINNIGEVNNYDKEKYFTIRSFGIEKNATTSYATSKTSGKWNRRLNFNLYLANPFENTKNIWYGVTYKENLSNKLSNDKKNSVYKHFINKSLKDFDTYNFQNVAFFEKLFLSDDRNGFIEAIKRVNNNINIEKQVVLIPKTGNFDKRQGNTFVWIFISFGIGTLIIFLMIATLKIDKKELNDYLKTNNKQYVKP